MLIADDRLGEKVGDEQRTIDDDLVTSLGTRFFEDEAAGRSGPPLTSDLPDLTIADAYEIQAAYVRLRIASGARLVGRKVGATNPVVQRLFNVTEPDFGVLLDDMVLADGARVAMSRLVQPRVEPEIGFLLGETLAGPGIQPSDVILATRAVVPCLEIIDSRIDDWNIGIVDTVADNGSSARCIVGDRLTAPTDVDLRLVGVILEVDGDVVATGAGAAALGNPAAAVAWLANTLARHDERLDAGMLVLPGSLTTSVPVFVGQHVVATFAGLGRASCRLA